MGAADDPIGHDDRLDSRLGDEGQHFFRNSVIGADVGLPLGKPASKVGSLGVLARTMPTVSLVAVLSSEP